MMNRVNGAQGVKLLECTNPVKDKWRVRWDVHNNEDGSADYMEAEFNGKPSEDTIKTMVSEWFNDRTNETILSGFVWNGMSVWLSTENQFNYKVAYDLAVQSDGKTLPVTFKCAMLSHIHRHRRTDGLLHQGHAAYPGHAG